MIYTFITLPVFTLHINPRAMILRDKAYRKEFIFINKISNITKRLTGTIILSFPSVFCHREKYSNMLSWKQRASLSRH